MYSFGILLLEMFTRKKPTDDMFDGEMSLKEWVSEAVEADAIDQVSAYGMLSTEKECVTFIFKLAMKCLAILPNERMDMSQVVGNLQKIKAEVVAGQTQRGRQHAITISPLHEL